MFFCASCRQTLDRSQNQHGIYHACATCHGRLIGLGVLRKAYSRETVNRIWRPAFDGLGTLARPCPVCTANMREVQPGAPEDPLHVDVCLRCHLVWFDGGELDALPPPPEPPPPPVLSPQARKVEALYRIKQIRATAEAGDSSLPVPDVWWKWIPGIFGLPVLMNSNSLSRLPWVTYSLAAIGFLLWIMLGAADAALANDTSYAGHRSFFFMLIRSPGFHAFVMFYFLVIFGEDVECYLGHRRMASLFLFGLATGGILHLVIKPDTALPLLGFGAGVAAVACFYMLLHPHARIGILPRPFLLFAVIPAWLAFNLWLLWHGVGIWLQLSDHTSISFLSHSGGALAGFIAWKIWRDQ